MPFLSEPQPRIIIAGAGIGGLSTALALHAAGFTDIHLFEASTQLTTLGVGINVQPSAVLVLRNLGLLPALEEAGVETQELNFYSRHGHPILSEPRGRAAGYAVPQFSVHRGEFQMLLLDAAKARLGADRVHLDHALTGYEQDESSITARFGRRGAPDTPPVTPSMTGAALIAADGINSTARRLLYPDEGPPRFSGRILWRGCVERAPYLTGASMVWAGHADQKFIAYPISGRAARRGASLVNWIAELRVRAADDPDTTPPPADWTKRVPKERFAGPFAAWECGGLRMADLIDSTESVFEFPMCDRDPVARWSFGRLTLLGDAAHAMYPIGSNGATQAILDAEALASRLADAAAAGWQHSGAVEAALAAYQDARLPPTAQIVMANRANGPDHVLQLAHERAPDGFANIYDVVPKDELEGIGAKYKALAGFEKDAVNRKASETEHLARRFDGAAKPKAA